MVDITTSKGICYAILALDDGRLTPEAKYFLIRVIYLYGDALVTMTVKELAKMTGLSDVAIANVRTLLCSLGYLKVTPVIDSSASKQKSGRPRQAFSISTEFIDNRMHAANQPECRYQDNHPMMLNRLLFWRTGDDSLRLHNVKKTRKAEGDLSIKRTFTVATRILLSVLYIHADPCGVVRDIGLSRLSRLLGVTEDRLKSQLNVIKDLGYLIDRLPGLTGKALYGLAIGAFYLNVHVEDIQSSGMGYTLLTLETNVINTYNERTWGYRLYDEARLRKNGLVFNEDDLLSQPTELAAYLSNWYDTSYLPNTPPNVDWSENMADLLVGVKRLLRAKGLYSGQHDKYFGDISNLFVGKVSGLTFAWCRLFQSFALWQFFCDRPISDVSRYLQHRLDRYSAMILNIGWDYIRVDRLYISDSVLNHITSSLFPRPPKNDDPDCVRMSALALFVYCIAYQQALLIKSLLLKTQMVSGQLDSNQSSFSFAIFPVRDPIYERARRITVAIRLGRSSGLKQVCAVRFVSEENKEPKVETFAYQGKPDKCLEIFREFGYELDVLQRMAQ